MMFTGERMIPGNATKRIENDHKERYFYILKLLEKKKGLNILDLACGEGYGSEILSNIVDSKVTGVDISHEAICHAIKKYKKNNLEYFKGDAQNFGENDIYDVVISFETIEHVSSYNEVIANYHRILKKNGVLFISSPNRKMTSLNAKSLHDKPENIFHTQEFTINELAEILEKFGFEIENVVGQRYFIYSKILLINKILKKFLKPEAISSYRLRRLSKYLEPRYFVIQARKL